VSRVLVTPRSITRGGGHPALKALRDAGHEVVLSTASQQPAEDELLRRLPGCAGYLAGVEPVTAAVLEAASDLRVISRNGVGVDNIDLAAADRLGIRVCTTPGANARGVAELALGLVFSLARAIPQSDRTVKAGAWERSKGIELAGRTLGVVGCGAIGRRVCELALGMGMQVAAHDPLADASFAPGPAFTYAALEDVLARADVLTLHCPAGGRPLLDAAALARMKPGAFIVNTARAALIDRAALLAALDEGRVAGAALDVFDEEPPVGDPLAAHPRVIATPHVGGFTGESVDRAVTAAVDNMLAALTGEALGKHFA
jgi:phosphoglycerate dehydrogenase-like enzyme